MARAITYSGVHYNIYSYEETQEIIDIVYECADASEADYWVGVLYSQSAEDLSAWTEIQQDEYCWLTQEQYEDIQQFRHTCDEYSAPPAPDYSWDPIDYGEDPVFWPSYEDPDLGPDPTYIEQTVGVDGSPPPAMSPTAKVALYGGLGVAGILGAALLVKKR